MSTARDISTAPRALLAPQLDYILVDGSSSMQSKWWDFMGALDTFINSLRAENINSHAICTTFDTYNISLSQRDCLLAAWVPLSTNPLTSFWGSTPLYDAINKMGHDLRNLDPSKASIVIVTDGDENASVYTTHVQAKAILDWVRVKGWQLTFIGCDFNNSKQAKLLGVDSRSAIGVQQRLLSDAAKNLAAKRIRYSQSGADMHFSDSEKQQFGGYLSAPQS